MGDLFKPSLTIGVVFNLVINRSCIYKSYSLELYIPWFFFFFLPSFIFCQHSVHLTSNYLSQVTKVSWKHQREKKTKYWKRKPHPYFIKWILAYPPKIFELFTPGLQDQCSNPWVSTEAKFNGFSKHSTQFTAQLSIHLRRIYGGGVRKTMP